MTTTNTHQTRPGIIINVQDVGEISMDEIRFPKPRMLEKKDKYVKKVDLWKQQFISRLEEELKYSELFQDLGGYHYGRFEVLKQVLGMLETK